MDTDDYKKFYEGDLEKLYENLKKTDPDVCKHISLEELMDAAKKVALTIASKGPLAVGASKRALNRGADLSMEAGLDFEATLFGSMFTTQDMREGTSAFLEKRKADFQGS